MRTRMLACALGVAAMVGLTGCPPPPTPTGTISCEGASGELELSPPVDIVEKPVAYSLSGPSTSVSCDDRSGGGITSARFEQLTARFPSISCVVTSGTTAEGTARVKWSDGSVSNADVTATLDGAYTGWIKFNVTSGRFGGWKGATAFAATPLVGSCFDEGISRESVTIGPITLRDA